MKKRITLLLTMALMILVMSKEVQAAAPEAPKDAAQTASIETGFRVDWSSVNGATQYYYSFSADDKTYTQESLTGNNGTENFINVVNKDILLPGTLYYVKIRAFNGSEYSPYVKVKAATAPKAPAYIMQTAADNNSVTVSWAASEGATGYMIRFGTSAKTAKDIQVIKTTSCRMQGLDPDSKYYLAIYPVKQVTNKFYASQNGVDVGKVVTTAGPIQEVGLYDWDVKSNIIMVQWSNAVKYESGYQVQFCKADGKKIKTYTIPGKRVKMKAFSNKAFKNTPVMYRVRSYTTLAGKKSYGAWSAFVTAVPQANVKATKVSNTSVKLSWDKIEGAASYTIYRATKEGGKYKKVKTTKKTSYTVDGLKTYKDYYFYVKANKVMIGGEQKSSTNLPTPNDINVYIYKYQTNVSEQ